MESKSSAPAKLDPEVAASLKELYELEDDEVTLLLSDEETRAFARDLVVASTTSASSLAYTKAAIKHLRELLKESYGPSVLKYTLSNE